MAQPPRYPGRTIRNTAAAVAASAPTVAPDYGRCPSASVPTPQGEFYIPGAARPIKNRGTNYIPDCITTMAFDPADWTTASRPWNYSPNAWPPQVVDDLLSTAFDTTSMSKIDKARILRVGKKHKEPPCFGKYCWQKTRFDNHLCYEDALGEHCNHSFDEWMRGCEDWPSRFELRKIPHMGVGVFSLHRWKKGDVLGPYLGKLLPEEPADNAYAHVCDIGPPFEISPGPAVNPTTGKKKRGPRQVLAKAYIDAEEEGYWTRFVNHSCRHNAEFQEARVGSTRVLALVCVSDIAVGEQITADYRDDYFVESGRRCRCGEVECRFPANEEDDGENEGSEGGGDGEDDAEDAYDADDEDSGDDGDDDDGNNEEEEEHDDGLGDEEHDSGPTDGTEDEERGPDDAEVPTEANSDTDSNLDTLVDRPVKSKREDAEDAVEADSDTDSNLDFLVNRPAKSRRDAKGSATRSGY